MKYLSKLLLAVAASTTLFSCSSDEPNVTSLPDDGAGFYATVKFTVPKTRSLDAEGVEIGKDYENKVSSLLVVLAKREGAQAPYSYKFLSSAYTGNPTTTNNTYTICFQNKEALYNYAGTTGGNKVYVFAYCNPTEGIKSAADALTAEADLSTFFDSSFTGSAEELATTWRNEGFLMTNHAIYESVLPSQDELKGYSSANNPYALTSSSNPLEVLRTAARFDYKDGAKPENGALTYEIKDIVDATKAQGTVKLTRMALFNMRDEFYYLPRTTDAAGNITLCPGATGNFYDFDNLMVTPSNRNFLNTLPFVGTSTESAQGNAFDPTKVITETKEWYNIATILGATEDNDNEWNGGETPSADKQGYYIWRYCTENAYPLNTTNYSPNEATGVVFEAEIDLNGDIKPDGTTPIFLYNGTMYANAQQICQTAENNKASQIYIDVKNVFDYDIDATGNVTNAVLKSVIGDDVLFSNDINIYRPKDGKYYCYYFYFNRHNDNGTTAETASDEFATIRNNVYKLSVTDIKLFGTFVPSTKVEDWDVYFNVDVEVKPWTVRINNIEF